jgi:hypothetical protein
MTGKTRVAIREAQFLINGRPTYEGADGVEGLLLNARLVQGVFDDRNDETRQLWAYADTGVWDAERNTTEFIAAMASWRDHGLLAFTLNLQGGSPYGYSQDQPWINSAFAADGALRDDTMARAGRILDAADDLGMVVILGLFYFGQEKVLRDEAAIMRAVDGAADWLVGCGHGNVLLEINNECNIRYQQPILGPERVHELIRRAKTGRALLVGTSYGGGSVPGSEVVRASDFLLLHGNKVEQPARIREMVRQTRAVPGYRPMPILFNEDDHYAFDAPDNNFVAALGEYASWGFFDYRLDGEGPECGFQSVPVDWTIGSARKRAFFALAKRLATKGLP